LIDAKSLANKKLAGDQRQSWMRPRRGTGWIESDSLHFRLEPVLSSQGLDVWVCLFRPEPVWNTHVLRIRESIEHLMNN